MADDEDLNLDDDEYDDESQEEEIVIKEDSEMVIKEDSQEDKEWSLGKRIIVGISCGAVAVGVLLGVYELWSKYKKSEPESAEEVVLSPEERITILDSLSNRKGYANADSALAELFRTQKVANQSSYELVERPSKVLDSLDVRLRRTNGELTEKQKKLEYIDSLFQANKFFGRYDGVFKAVEELKKRPTNAGYSQKTLNEKVRQAETQGRASGYESGLEVGKAKALEQIFSHISAQANALNYTVVKGAGYIEYTVSTISIPLDRLPLTGEVLITGIDREVRINALRERLLGLGVKKEDVGSYLEGSGINKIRITIHPITREATGVHAEGLKGKMDSYKPIKVVGE
ncbi:hypothetical protein HYT57_00135 [Candidatus Woesearchaeota archaeon]|nr:hypothetical protein [Candidatus Woesearchaeota archaeon]